MIYILGRTCSGKDTIVNRLIEKYGYEKIITYTTRPMRKGEVQDKTYHFISEKEFKEKINSNFFLEYKKYNTVYGECFFGSAKEDFIDSKNKIIIVTPDGYKDSIYHLNKNGDKQFHLALYIYANNSTILKRLKKRGDNEEEADRRFTHDSEDFKGVVDIVDRIFYNNEFDEIETVVDEIHEYIQRVM